MPAPANQSGPGKKVVIFLFYFFFYEIVIFQDIILEKLHFKKERKKYPRVCLCVCVLNQGATDKKAAAGNAAKPTSRKKVCSATTHTKKMFVSFVVNDVIIFEFVIPPTP